MLKRYTLTVEGLAPFPVDMLRYDACYPATEADSGRIERLGEPGNTDRVRVTVAKSAGTAHAFLWTPARWESFGWKVVA